MGAGSGADGKQSMEAHRGGTGAKSVQSEVRRKEKSIIEEEKKEADI